MSTYQVIIASKLLDKVAAYRKELIEQDQQAGLYLYKQMRGQKYEELSNVELLNLIFKTKIPRIFAESEVRGQGQDWNARELSILGGITVAIDVRVFDNARHQNPLVHEQPFEATLLFCSGALLRSGFNQVLPADWLAVMDQATNQIDFGKYYTLYEQRLLPLMKYASQKAIAEGKKALITIPGLGCGQFAGRFQGQLGELLKRVILALLERHAFELKGLQALYFDPYNECSNESYTVEGIDYLVRPLLQANESKSQLSKPQAFAADYAGCMLFSVVAWDQVSWPGNDFYVGSRATDDGVKAAATDALWKMTGVEGGYDVNSFAYQPPTSYRNWEEVVESQALSLDLVDRLHIF